MADYKPHTVLGAMDITVNKKPSVPAPRELTAVWRVHLNTQAFKTQSDKCDHGSNTENAEGT